MNIVRKGVFDSNGNPIRFIYGVEVETENEVLRPIYPYSSKKQDLEKFISLYEEDLIDFFLFREKPWFSMYLFGFDTESKDSFKNRWFNQGVLID